MEMDQAAVSEVQTLELEKKYRLTKEEWDSVVSSLEGIGAQYLGEDFETNTIYFGTPLEASGGVVRIRRTQDRALLTFKRRLEGPGDVKRQVEHETEISDADSTARIITELGLEPKLIYDKRRKTWRLRDTEIVLDELPFGLFMEIEGSVTGIKEIEILLGIENVTVEHETYPEITARLGQKIENRIEARF
jgi:adenylate cyclase class 2